MTGDADLSRVGTLIADPKRAKMLLSLLSGQAESASALADAAGGFALTSDGEAAMDDLSIDVPALRSRRRPLTRACKDWTEPGHHLAGGLGAAIAAQCFERRWIERGEASRIVRVTPAGRRGLRSWSGVEA